MRHTISVLVENHPGVLARIAGLFSGRGFNIDSLSVGETENPKVSRMTVVVTGDDEVVEQISKQLNKLIDTIKVVDLTKEEHVERELVLLKVAGEGAARPEIMQIVDIFRAKIVDVGPKSVVVEATGTAGKVEALIDLLRQFGIKEMARTGHVAITRSSKSKK